LVSVARCALTSAVRPKAPFLARAA
jgi:hypothetical protein